MQQAKFAIGQIVQHRRFNYRGVIFDADPVFSADEAWYEQVALSRPPKDEPWYHVLVDQAQHTTYVAERNLAATDSARPVQHPLLAYHFDDFIDGRYFVNARNN